MTKLNDAIVRVLETIGDADRIPIGDAVGTPAVILGSLLNALGSEITFTDLGSGGAIPGDLKPGWHTCDNKNNRPVGTPSIGAVLAIYLRQNTEDIGTENLRRREFIYFDHSNNVPEMFFQYTYNNTIPYANNWVTVFGRADDGVKGQVVAKKATGVHGTEYTDPVHHGTSLVGRGTEDSLLDVNANSLIYQVEASDSSLADIPIGALVLTTTDGKLHERLGDDSLDYIRNLTAVNTDGTIDGDGVDAPLKVSDSVLSAPLYAVASNTVLAYDHLAIGSLFIALDTGRLYKKTGASLTVLQTTTFNLDAAGVATFKELTDTPAAIEPHKFVVGNADGTALEYASVVNPSSASARTTLLAAVAITWPNNIFSNNTVNLSSPLTNAKGELLIRGRIGGVGEWHWRVDNQAFFSKANGESVSEKLVRATSIVGFNHTSIWMLRTANNNSVIFRSAHGGEIQPAGTSLAIDFIPDGGGIQPITTIYDGGELNTLIVSPAPNPNTNVYAHIINLTVGGQAAGEAYEMPDEGEYEIDVVLDKANIDINNTFTSILGKGRHCFSFKLSHLLDTPVSGEGDINVAETHNKVNIYELVIGNWTGGGYYDSGDSTRTIIHPISIYRLADRSKLGIRLTYESSYADTQIITLKIRRIS